LLVEAEVGDELLELAVLLLEQAEAPQLGVAHLTVLLLPAEERGLADAELAADVLGGQPGLGLPQGECNLLLAESRLLGHGSEPLDQSRIISKLAMSMVQKTGRMSPARERIRCVRAVSARPRLSRYSDRPKWARRRSPSSAATTASRRTPSIVGSDAMAAW